MKQVIPFVLAIAFFLACPVLAQTPPLRIYCEACRDIVEHPEDARNFGVNQLYGADSWLTFEQADRFDVVDSFGNFVTVDINIDYVVLGLKLLRDEIPYALTFVLQIRLIYWSGDIITYKFDIADLRHDGVLPVPASMTNATDDRAPATGSGDSGEGDDDYLPDEDDGPFEYEPEDGSCSACEVYFDADRDGVLDDEPVEWIEEL